MTDPALDELITGDLQALAASHEHPRAIALDHAFRGHQPAVPTLTTAESVSRCAEESAVRDTWRPIFAHRVARIVTGVAAAIAAAGTLAFLHDPAGVVERDYNIGGLGLLLAIVYGVAFMLAGRRFDRGPRAGTQTRVARLDGWATGLVMVGVVTLLPMFAYLTGGNTTWLHGGGFDRASAVVFGGYLEATAALALIPALVLGGAVHRARHGAALPAWVRRLETWRLVAIGTTLGVLAVSLAARASAAAGDGEHLTDIGQLGRALLLQLSVVQLSAWFTLWLRRRELARAATVAPDQG